MNCKRLGPNNSLRQNLACSAAKNTMRHLVFLFPLLTIFLLADAREPIRSVDGLDGHYYEVSESNRYFGCDLVLSHNGKDIPPPDDNPEAPTKPGLHCDNVHYPFAKVHFSNGSFSFETKSVSKVSFRFDGVLEMKPDPDFDPQLPLRSLRGVLREFRDKRPIADTRVTFGEAIVL